MSDIKEVEIENVIDKLDLSLLLQENDVKIYKETDTIYDIINTFLEKNYSEEAFYIVDLGKVIRQYQKWKDLLPRITPFYAVKCNPDILVCKVLASLFSNFDCASKSEISQIMSITNDPSRIIFANPCKMSNQLKYSRANDIDTLTFDSDHELYKIKLYHPYAKLILRIQVDDSKSVCKFNSKFGCKLDEVEKILKLAQTMNLDVNGVSFHVGSNCGDAMQYYNAIKDARKVFDIAKKLNYDMKIIDIGGGYSDEADHIKFEDCASIINKGLDEIFSDIEDLKIWSEPGRFMVNNSHTLVINVIGKKEFIDENGEKNFIYYMNDGVYGSFNCIYFDHAKPRIYPFNERNEKQYKSTIFGPTCDSLDKIADNVMLPELVIGEWCYIEHFGAYTTAASSTFNGFLNPKVYYIMTV